MAFKTPRNLNVGVFDDLLQLVSRASSIVDTGVRTPGDPLGDTLLHVAQQVNREISVEGFIQYLVPGTGSYRVALSNNLGIVCCQAISQNGRNASLEVHYAAGEQVRVLYDPTTHSGKIIGLSNNPRVKSADGWSQFVSQGSGVGGQAIPAYREYITTLGDNGGLLDACNSSAYDCLPDDWTNQTVSGVGFHRDAMMAYMEASDTCGVYVFYDTGLLRVSGDRLEIESDSYVVSHGIDQGEIYSESTGFIYPWEITGKQWPATSTIEYTVTDAEEAIKLGKNLYEPTDEAGLSFSRVRKYEGYVGQCQYLCVVLPTEAIEYSAQESVNTPGVFRQQVMMNGAYLLESAKRVTLAKTSFLPAPQRVRHQDSKDGDSLENGNYKFSGLYGDGPDHEVADTLAELEGLERSFDNVMSHLDTYAYSSAWQGMVGFYEHTGDFVVSDVSGEVAYTPNAEDLDQDDFLTPPDGEIKSIDHRSESKYYRINSAIDLLDDGSIVISNGQGASIRLVGGVVELSGTAIRLNAAKSLTGIAGLVSLKGHDHAEVSSSNGNLLLKSQKHLWALAGNGGSGSLLLESRGSSDGSVDFTNNPEDTKAGGVIIKSTQSALLTYSRGAYIRSTPAQPIIIDAGDESTIVMRARSTFRYVGSTDRVAFGTRPESLTKVHTFSTATTQLDSALFVKGQYLSTGGIQVLGNVNTANGHYGSSRGGPVGDLKINGSDELTRSNIARQSESVREQLEWVKEYFVGAIQTPYLANNKPGHAEVIRKISVGFPSSDFYRTNNLHMLQPAWQNSLQGQGNITTWSEPDVYYQGGGSSTGGQRTMPWPGVTAWERQGGWVPPKADVLFNASTQSPINPNADKDRYRDYGQDAPERPLISIKSSLQVFNYGLE